MQINFDKEKNDKLWHDNAKAISATGWNRREKEKNKRKRFQVEGSK